jgi:L-ascorbate metabolism protein UlaG (beta-lactamase superfamily)
MMTGDSSMLKVMWKFFNKPKNTVPPKTLPSVKTNLKILNSTEPTIVWFGHSSYLINISNKNILVDPVFCGHASPFSFTTNSFSGSNVYSVEDMPDIDILILTHDHYDHLDYETVVKLNQKTKQICTSLGVASHLIYWGIDEQKIIEFDWLDSHQVTSDITLTTTPARHFSGRLFARGKTLWSSFVLETSDYKIFIGGDSGYDAANFKMIAEKFGGFDIAMLEAGQYNTDWANIHTMPEETVQASIDLNAKVLLPVHWGKFSLALHPWNEPIERVCKRALETNAKLTTPMIGEPVVLDRTYPDKKWWAMI